MAIENVVDKSFHYNILIMKIAGLYPVDSFKRYNKIYSYIIYLFFTVLFPVLSTAYMLWDKDSNFDQVTNSIFITMECLNMPIKFLPFIRHPENLILSLKYLESPLFSNYTKKQEEIVKDCIKYSQRAFYFFFSVCGITIFLWATKPLFQPVLILPIEIWMPYDIYASSMRYIFTYVYIFLCGLNAGLSSVVTDSLTSLLLYHATGQVKILKDNLEHIMETVDAKFRNTKELNQEEKSELKAALTYETIKEYVLHYDAILQFVKQLEKTCSLFLFSQYLTSIIVICFSCLRLTTVEPWSTDFVTVLFILISLLIDVYLFGYFGSILYEESDSIGTAIYLGKWYEFDLKCKKSLIILMQRSQFPTIITAEKIFDVTLDSLTLILRKSYSAFAVFKSYY